MFFAVKNHVSQTVRECPEPWGFQPTENITQEIRESKAARQNWYRSEATQHNFFSGIEGINPNVRVSKNNPPQAIHAFSADFDVPISKSKAAYAVEQMRIKPSWLGDSLGGGLHVLWLLERPIRVRGDWALTVELLTRAKHWLELDLLPGVDGPAFVLPSQYYCNGCAWTSTHQGAAPAAAVQAFFFSVVAGMKRGGSGLAEIPIDVLEKALREKWPSFDWPEAFAFESQGPSFWIEGSTSARSAIVKKDGIFSFAAHAAQPFYSWADLLGNEFVAKYRDQNIHDTTADIFYDGDKYWRKVNARWAACGKPEIELEFRCRHVSNRAEKGEVSRMDQCFQFIHNQQRIDHVGPHVLFPEGVIVLHGETALNTVKNRIIQPMEGRYAWEMDFGFLAKLLDKLFDPADQLPHFLAWWKYFYECALHQRPEPGQNVFFMGGTGVGKTLTSREVFGGTFGGGIDASQYLLEGSNFNSEFMERAVWCVDDDTVSEDPKKQSKFAIKLKKIAANTDHNYNRKFVAGGSVQWIGRVICTSNLDAISSQILGPLDQSIKDKTSLFRCAHEPGFVFPSREECRQRTAEELPKFLRWLLDWPVPEYIRRDARFGFQSHHNETLLALSLQNSPASLLKEILLHVFTAHFQANPDAKIWTGPLQNLITLIVCTNPVAGESVHKMSHPALMRYLTLIEKEEAIRITTTVGKFNVKMLTFYREDYAKPDSL